MNTVLKDSIFYICTYYPRIINRTTLVKLTYLVDVEFYTRFYSKLTDVNYRFEHFGPFSWDIVDCAQELIDENKLKMIQIPSAYGGESYIYKALEKYDGEYLDKQALIILSEVLNKFSSYTFSDLLSYVYTTPPMKNANQGEIIDFRVLVNANQLSNSAEYVAKMGLDILESEARESIKEIINEFNFEINESRQKEDYENAKWQASIIQRMQ